MLSHPKCDSMNVSIRSDMPRGPEISVIIPVYNAADTLERCLQSVLSSAVDTMEVICVNDGSADRSGEILAAWAEKDARLRIITQQNAGVSAARNAALREATGQYITFVDADDEITSTYLIHLLQAARRYDADVVVCGQQQHNEKGRYSQVVLPFRDVSQVTPEDMATLPPSVCSHLYAARALQTPGGVAQFPLRIRYGEDTAFHYSVYPHCRHVVQIEETGYIIHYTGGSSNSRVSTLVFDMLKALEWLAAHYQQYGMPPDCKACLVHYAAHTIRRIHSQGLHRLQAEAAGSMRRILQTAGITTADLTCLKKRTATILADILHGGNGLNLSYYFKRVRKWLKN